MAAEASFAKTLHFHENTFPIKVAMADDHQLIINGFAGMLDAVPGIALCASFLNGKALLDWYDGSNANVILLDIHMPVLNGMETGKQLLNRFPAARIIVLSVDDDQHLIRFMFELGVYAYLLKDADPADFIEAIIRVHIGEKVFPGTLTMCPGDMRTDRDNILSAKLSDREIQVLRLIVDGKTTLGIADQLNLSPDTVKSHRKKLLHKLGASNVAQLIANAFSKGLL